jgi:4-hydroxybenzoate polyprenyltransferase
LAIAGLNAELNLIFFVFLIPGFFHLNNQVDVVDLQSSEDCKAAFKSNVTYGVIALMGFLLGKI